ncbi:MAG: D-2-hydroxyacid dehydrogenase family protein, partial [Pseudomonadota bacterium]
FQPRLASSRRRRHSPAMKICILDDYADTVRTLDAFAMLDGHDIRVLTRHEADAGALAEAIGDADALVLIRERTRITADLLDRLPNLTLIAQHGATPHIDVEACRARGITVSSGKAGGTPPHATAELTFALVLAALRQIPAQDASLRAGRWQTHVGRTLHGKRFGVWSYGRIGRAVAGYARAFGCETIAWGSEDARARAGADGIAVAESHAALFETCDVVSLHLRLADRTRGIVGSGDLAAMKTDAILINTSRAGLIADGALVAALQAGRPGGAAVDVFETEPAGADHPLLALPHVVATPHLGYVTREEFEAQFARIFENVLAFETGAPINVVTG